MNEHFMRRLVLLATVGSTAATAGCWNRALPTIDPSGTGNTSGGGMLDSGVKDVHPGSPGSGGVYGVGSGGGPGTGGARDAGTNPDAGGVMGTGGARMADSRKLDIIFMIDDSASMAPLQAKLRTQIPAFLDALIDPVTQQLPQLHVAVISSSYGAGAWGNVNQCHSHDADPSTLGDDRGRFLQGAVGLNASPCTMLHTGAKYLDNGDGASIPANYNGNLRDALSCMAVLGDQGCGFESQFASTYYALYKASQPDDPDNGGFLRDDARLAIVMVTNEDDCSVRGDSLLLSPGINSVSDPIGLGALASYRCNEFGHLCGGQPPPHTGSSLPVTGVTLNNCVSAEEMGKTDSLLTDPNGNPDPTMGHLWPTVEGFTAFIKQFKTDPRDVFVAAIAGPTTDGMGNSLYRVIPQANPAAGGEITPSVAHSCVQTTSGSTTPEFADPAVRIKQFVDGFGTNGVFYPICANDFSAAMVGIARAIRASATTP